MINHVLVIDDDSEILDVLTEYLKLYGVSSKNIHIAQNPIEALEIFREYQRYISLIIVDYYMPRSNGAEFCEIIKKDHPHLKIMMQTGDPKINNKMVTHIDQIIYKPFEYNVFEQAINELEFGPPEFDLSRLEKRESRPKFQNGLILDMKNTPIASLVLNQSSRGVGVAIKPNSDLKQGDTISFIPYSLNESKFNEEKKYRGKIIWIKIINVDLCTLGIQWIN